VIRDHRTTIHKESPPDRGLFQSRSGRIGVQRLSLELLGGNRRRVDLRRRRRALLTWRRADRAANRRALLTWRRADRAANRRALLAWRRADRAANRRALLAWRRAELGRRRRTLNRGVGAQTAQRHHQHKTRHMGSSLPCGHDLAKRITPRNPHPPRLAGSASHIHHDLDLQIAFLRGDHSENTRSFPNPRPNTTRSGPHTRSPISPSQTGDSPPTRRHSEPDRLLRPS
jgi:hypothetical protein